jgi:Ca2+:H+ antiporter
MTSTENSDFGLTSNEDAENRRKPPSPFASEPPTMLKSLRMILTNTWINVFLIFIPLGYIAYALKWSDTLIFTLNFLAIIPLAKLLGYATEDISLRVGQVVIKMIKFNVCNK